MQTQLYTPECRAEAVNLALARRVSLEKSAQGKQGRLQHCLD